MAGLVAGGAVWAAAASMEAGTGGGLEGCSGATSSSQVESNGTSIPAPHCGHFDFRPAFSSLDVNRFPHEPHENLIAITAPLRVCPWDASGRS